MCYRGIGRSGGTPLIAVVESADLRKLDNVAIRRSLNGSLPRGVFAEAQVGSGSVVVDEVSSEKAVKMFLVQHDNMIEALAPNGADETLDVGILPG